MNQIEIGKQVKRPPSCFGAAEAASDQSDFDILGDSEPRNSRHRLEAAHNARCAKFSRRSACHVAACEPDRTGMRPLKPDRTLTSAASGAVGPSDRAILAGRDGERHVVVRHQPAEANRNMLGRELQGATSCCSRQMLVRTAGTSRPKNALPQRTSSCTPMIAIGLVVYVQVGGPGRRADHQLLLVEGVRNRRYLVAVE